MNQKQKFVLDLIESTNGKIFSISFYKKNGELRRMTARIQVKKGVTGRGMSYDPKSRGLKPVYSMHDQGWRMVSLDNVEHFKFKDTEEYFDV